MICIRAKEARGVEEKERVAVVGSLARLRNADCGNISRCNSQLKAEGSRIWRRRDDDV